MNMNWWDGNWDNPEWYESLSEEYKDRLAEVKDFLGNNCLGWFQGSEKARKATIEVLCRLPNDAAEALLCNSDIVVIDGSSSCAWPRHHARPAPNTVLQRPPPVVVLRVALREMPYKAVVGEVAHEFAHVFRGHGLCSSSEQEAARAQEEADTTARQWGFGDEIDLLNRQPVSPVRRTWRGY